jgi:hypothetical protein
LENLRHRREDKIKISVQEIGEEGVDSIDLVMIDTNGELL